MIYYTYDPKSKVYTGAVYNPTPEWFESRVGKASTPLAPNDNLEYYQRNIWNGSAWVIQTFPEDSVINPDKDVGGGSGPIPGSVSSSAVSITSSESLSGSASTQKSANQELKAYVSSLQNGGVTNAYLSSDVKIGSLADLNTTAKDSVISAINELVGIGAKAIIDVTALPSQDIDESSFYRIQEKRSDYYRNGALLPSAPQGYEATASSPLSITTSGIDEGLTLTAWADITTQMVDDWTAAGYLAAASWGDGDFYQAGADDYGYKDEFTRVQIDDYAIYANCNSAWWLIARQDYPLSDLVRSSDIALSADFTSPKAEGIDIVLGDGSATNPDIINDAQAYRYADNKTSSNNYLNSRMDDLESKADGKTKTIFVSALPPSPELNTYYYVEAGTNNYTRYFVDSFGVVKSLGDTQLDVSTLVAKSAIAAPSASSTEEQVASAKGSWDAFAPKAAAYASGDISAFINPDSAVFDFAQTGGQLRQNAVRRFFVQFPNPITGATFYGAAEVSETINNYGTSGSSVIWQTVTQVNPDANTGASAVFRRCGQIAGITDATKITQASITWREWYPVEHPRFAVPVYSEHVSAGALYATVTGGILTVRGDNVRFVTGITATAADICRIDGIDISAVKYVNGDNYQYSQLVAFNPSQMGAVNHLIGLVRRSVSGGYKLAVCCWRGDVDYPTANNATTFFSVSCGLGY